MEPQIIEGTAREVMARLAVIPGEERIRVVVGHPSLTVIARKLQEIAGANGMTDEVHDTLIQSLTHDC